MAPMRFSDYLCTELRAEAVHAALQLLITNKGCIVYQHLQSAPGTRCSASCFLISDLGSGLQCCSAAVDSVYGDGWDQCCSAAVLQ